MTAPFVVIGCGKAKRALARGETCRAIDLYTGPLFAARLAHARALGGPHAILSAAYTLLTPDAEVSGYEADLRRRSKRERADWARNVAHAIKMLTKPGQRVIVLASGPYSAFADHLVAGGRDVVVLGEGMQIGELISYHQREAERLAAALEAARAKMAVAMGKLKRRVPPTPAPRYDSVFAEGANWLESLAGEPVAVQSGTVTIDPSVWDHPRAERLERELAEMRADRDSWRQQAEDARSDALRYGCERDEANRERDTVLRERNTLITCARACLDPEIVSRDPAHARLAALVERIEGATANETPVPRLSEDQGEGDW